MSIKFTSINSQADVDLLENNNFNIFLYGTILDDRGQTAFNFLSKLGSQGIKLIYQEDKYVFSLDGEQKNKQELYTWILQIDQTEIFLDATTLTFIEILYLLDAINSEELSNITINLLYIEPKDYSLKPKIIHSYKDEFELSSGFSGFQPIPDFLSIVDSISEKIDLIAFLGFEENRLGMNLENDDQSSYNSFTPVVSIPAFTPGWENRSISRHLPDIREYNSLAKTFQYVSANNPYQAYQLLNNYASGTKRFMIAPIGTKPSAIGSAVFLVNAKENKELEVGVIYDFPIKRNKRSNGIGKSHLFKVKRV